MTLNDLGNLGEAVSGFAVVISLLYVAYELRSNTRTIRATSAASSQDTVAEWTQALGANSAAAELLARAVDHGSLGSLTLAESMQVTMVLRSLVQRMESMYFRYEAGLLEERVWAVRRGWLAGFVKTPLVAEWWRVERESSIYTRDFIVHIEGAEAEPIGPYGTADTPPPST